MPVAQVPPGINKMIVQKAPGQARWRPTVKVDGESRRSANGLAVPLRHAYWTVTQSPSLSPRHIAKASLQVAALRPVWRRMVATWTASGTSRG
jgi:hypothetical protein